MAAKPKLSPERWALIRAAWEADPRKPLSWLIDELDLPVSAEALRLRAKAEGWVKGRVELAGSKLGKSPKSKLAPEIPSLEDEAEAGGQDGDGMVVAPRLIRKRKGLLLST